MIAKQIEPPGMEVRYSRNGDLLTISGLLDCSRKIEYGNNFKRLEIYNGGQPLTLSDREIRDLAKFLTAIRHLREPESDFLADDDQVTCENCCEPVRTGKTCDTCRLIVTSKELEEAILLLSSTRIFLKTDDTAAGDMRRHADAFLSRVGGDNER